MNFVMGSLLGKGMIGFVFTDTLGMVLSYITFFGMAILSIIGLVIVLKVLFKGLGGRKKTAYEKWAKKNHMD